MTRVLAGQALRFLFVALMPLILAAAQPQKPLVNADVVEMVKSGLPESTTLAAMQANPTNFDVTPSALIALNNAGVSSKIMDAMIAATRNAARAGTAVAGRTTPAVTTVTANQPSVVLLQGDERRNLPIERTRMAQTAAKAKSLGSLATDRALDQTLRTGISTAVASTGRNAVGSIAGETAGTVVGGLFSGSNKPKDVTYVWALQDIASHTTLSTDEPAFAVSLNNMIGVKPDEYSPMIVKLTPTTNKWRLVGATEGKESAGSRSALDWPIYSSFIEDRVPVQVRKLGVGDWQVSTTGPLAPGEYALVLRPDSKDKKFSGQDVARNQGDGLLFNSAWSFAVK